MGSRNARAGSALIEVLIALVMLALAGTGFITLLGQTAHTMRMTLVAERETRSASEQLRALMLLDADSLTAMAGRRALRGWTVDIVPRPGNVFDLSIAATDTTAVLLKTSLYRRNSDSNATTP